MALIWSQKQSKKALVSPGSSWLLPVLPWLLLVPPGSSWLLLAPWLGCSWLRGSYSWLPALLLLRP
jgi:hypothetical protein